MALTDEQLAKLRAAADERGLDADALIAAAEAPDDEPAAEPAAPASSGEDRPIFMWHKPFVRVRELRQRLGLTERLDDDDLTCAEYEARHGVAAAPAQSTADMTQ